MTAPRAASWSFREEDSAQLRGVLQDFRTTLGLVKLRMKAAVSELTTIFTAMFERGSDGATQVDSAFLGEAEDELDKLFGA